MLKKENFSWIALITLTIFIGVGAGLLIREHIPLIMVSGPSMGPSFYDGERVFYEHPKNISRGDVVLFYDENGDRIIKRAIGLPGETIYITSGIIIVDGEVLDEKYMYGEIAGGGIAKEPYTIPEGTYFVIGDNYQNSLDSRITGPVKAENIFGVIRDR